MKIHINVIKGDVVLTFDGNYSWVALPPAEAENLAQKITEAAQRAIKEVRASVKP